MQLQNIKKYFAILFILLIGLFGIIILTTGIYFKFNKLKSGNNSSLFLRKILGIGLITIVFTIFTVILSICLNKIFINCPEYDNDPEHPWFKKQISIQLIDILISLCIIVIVKYLLTTIISNSIDYFIQNKKYKYINLLFEEGTNHKIRLIDIRQKGGNVTTAFITLLFHNKLRNKINYLSKKYIH